MQKVAVNLQKMDKKVILLDTNLSNPNWGAATQGDGNKNGLEAYLAGKAQLTDIVTEKEGVAYICCGQAVVNGLELLVGEAFVNLLAQLKQQYDYILVDTAPMLYVPDALRVAEQAEGMAEDNLFTDVPGSHWAAGYVNYAANFGIIAGRGNGIFDPEAVLDAYRFSE